jgi:DNA replication and repair protein RecF
MAVQSVTMRDFRCYESAAADLGEGLTVVSGPNGAGKTNLLEAVYFGATGRSCRTANDREVVRFGAPASRVVVTTAGALGQHQFAVGFAPGEPKRMTADGAPVERLLDAPYRPLISVFLPDRLELVKGVPAGRRAHLDQFTGALWPARVQTRRSFAQAIAQRNALLARIRAGRGSRSAIGAWDAQFARHALQLMADRREAIELLRLPFAQISVSLGLEAEATVAYHPRSRAATVDDFLTELEERLDSDLERGFTGHGPHRDDVGLSLGGRELRTFGSQGQQRVALLALLLAERRVIAGLRDDTPLLLLDDVMSELDRSRRTNLIELLRAAPGQTLITTTDLEHVPGATEGDVTRIAVAGGALLQDALVA